MAKNAKQEEKDPKKGTAVTKSGDVGGAMVLMQDQTPEHIKQGQARGSENVQTDDLVIPRLEIVQSSSPCLDEKNEAEYIPGAKIGDLINSVTSQNYGKEVFVVNVNFTKQWLVWKDRKKGGGFFGAYTNPAEAEDRAKEEGGEKEGVESVDTPTHLCLILNRDTGGVDEIMIPMPRTKAKVSRAWNSMIRMTGQDRFARVYRVTTAQEKNKTGDIYQNYVIAQSGFPAKALYDKAEKLYEQVKAGSRKMTMDATGFDVGGKEAGDPDSEM